MKIRMITFHTPKNYGAVLQAYSLMSYLKTFCADVKIIDYNTEALRNCYPLIARPKNLKSFVITVLSFFYFLKKRRKYQKFDNFVRENLDLTKRFESFEELKCENWGDCILVTGSDQVFNPTRIEEEIKTFYIDFAQQNKRKISYAASFGVSEIKDKDREKIASLLENFDFISVREKSGVDIVESLTDKQAVEVLDPVFLNSKDFWISCAKPYKKEFKNYLLYYRLLNSAKNDAEAIRIAREKSLDLVVITDGIVKFFGGEILRNVGVQEFLYLIANADFVATDSFHGVAFSLLFEKQFIFCDMFQQTNERGNNLLDKAGIKDQVRPEGYSSDSKIDYENVQNTLSELIEKSKNYLNKALR